MNSLVRQIYKELMLQQKYIKREDLHNTKKSNQLILRLIALLETQIEENEKKMK